MDIRYHAEGARRSARARRRILREGRTPNGHRLWTKKEDAIVRHFYPDYRAVKRRLKRRSVQAIVSRVHTLGLSPKNRSWKMTDIARLRRMWKEATKAEILAAFPDRSWHSVANKGKAFGIWRRPWVPNKTGHPIVDAIRMRAVELKLSLSDIDAMCNGRHFFANSSRRKGMPRSSVLLRAVKALDGHIEVVWH